MEEPKTLAEARKYQGRRVKKPFLDPKTRRKRLFDGHCYQVAKLEGEINYRIKYEDSDTEDILWVDFFNILQPEDMDVPGLEDLTNRQQQGGSALTSQTKRCRQGSRPSSVLQSVEVAQGADDDDEVDRPAKAPRKAQQGRRSTVSAGGVHGGEAGPSSGGRRQRRSAACAAADNDMADDEEQDEEEEEVQQEDEDEEQEEAEEKGRNRGKGRSSRAKRARAVSAEPYQEQQEEGGEEHMADQHGQEQADEEGGQQPEAQMRLPGAPDGVETMSKFEARTQGSAGHIKKVYVENFMCHECFEIEMGPHVTLISGQNGSGKSAIMQALQVCLGAKARETGRGSKAAEFVRRGVDEARVRVTLWNTGSDAFCPDLYGDEITVERVIKAKGGGSMVMLSASKRRVTTKRSDLDALLDHFAMDAANPLTIVTQDTARTFSGAEQAKHAQDKYRYFMEGSMLQETKDKLTLSNQRVTEMAQAVEAARKDLQDKTDEEAQVRSKVEKLKGMERFVHDREVLEKAVPWQHVRSVAAREQAVRLRVERYGPEHREVLDQLVVAAKAEEERLKERKRQLKADEEEHNKGVNSTGSQALELRRIHMERRREVEKYKRGADLAARDLGALQQDKEVIEVQMSQDAGGNSKAAEARRAVEEHQKLMTARSEALHKVSEQVDEAAKAKELVSNKLMGLEQQEQHARRSVQDSQAKANQLQGELQRLSAQQGSRLIMFGGPQAVHLAQLVSANARRFESLPIGPIGNYLNITDQRWSVAVEVVCGTAFNSYLVGSGRDAAVLRELRDQAGVRSLGITVVPLAAPMHAIPPARRPHAPYFPLIDVLQVADARARAPILNYLVDKFRIESVALAQTDDAGRRVMYDRAAGPHITQAYDPQGNGYKRNASVAFVDRNPNPRMRARLAADMSQYIEQLRRELAEEETQLGAHQEDQARHCAAVRAARAEQAACEAAHKEAMAGRARLKTELRRLQEQAPQLPDSLEEDEEALMLATQLTQLQTEIFNSEQTVGIAQEALRHAQEALNKVVQQMDSAQERLQEQANRGERIRTELQAVDAQLQEVGAVHGMGRKERDDLVARLNKAAEYLQRLEAGLRAARDTAERVCDEVEGSAALAAAEELMLARVAQRLQQRARGLSAQEAAEQAARTIGSYMTVDALSGELARVVKRIADAEREAGANLHELEAQLMKLDKEVSRSTKFFDNVRSNLQLLQAGYARRIGRYNQLRDSYERLVQTKFNQYMARRQHQGNVVFDHTAGTMSVKVKIKAKVDPNAKVAELGTLSGGEKSYTTVSLLLAIGHCTESPFRAMDEYDVFMDTHYRLLSTETLLGFALENPAYQYIFLTPQDLSAVKSAYENVVNRNKAELPAAFLKLKRMLPPRANSTAA